MHSSIEVSMKGVQAILILGSINLVLAGCSEMSRENSDRVFYADGDADGDIDGDADGDVDGDADGDIDGDADGDVDGDADGDVDGDADGDIDGDADGDVDGDADGLTIFIHVRATTDPFSHQDGLSGQTPLNHSNGIRSFSMLRTRDDTAPEHVFDHGVGYIEAGYNDGDDTIVGSAPLLDVAEGHYSYGRVVISHVRYRIAATGHYGDWHAPGTLNNIHVLSNETELDETIHNHGWYSLEFNTTGLSLAPIQGTSGSPIVPSWPSGALIEAAFEEGETVLYYPINIDVDHRAPRDIHQIIEFNVHESFRWEDQDEQGYQDGVFDFTPTTFEPVRRFGANNYWHYIDEEV